MPWLSDDFLTQIDVPSEDKSESAEEKEARVSRQIGFIRKDLPSARVFPVKVGQEVFQCPILKLRVGHWALLGEMPFPVKRDFSAKVFVLDENAHQISLQEIVEKNINGAYSFCEWF